MEQRKCLFTVRKAVEPRQSRADVEWVHIDAVESVSGTIAISNWSTLGWTEISVCSSSLRPFPRNPPPQMKIVYLFRSIILMDFLFLFFHLLCERRARLSSLIAVIHYTRFQVHSLLTPKHPTTIRIRSAFIKYLYRIHLFIVSFFRRGEHRWHWESFAFRSTSCSNRNQINFAFANSLAAWPFQRWSCGTCGIHGNKYSN